MVMAYEGGRQPAGTDRPSPRARRASEVLPERHIRRIFAQVMNGSEGGPCQPTAAPGPQARQHLPQARRHADAPRFRRSAADAHPGCPEVVSDVHAGLRGARTLQEEPATGPLDRHLRSRCQHVRLHAGRAAAAGRPAHGARQERSRAAGCRRSLLQPVAGPRQLVHEDQPTGAAAERVLAAAGPARAAGRAARQAGFLADALARLVVLSPAPRRTGGARFDSAVAYAEERGTDVRHLRRGCGC